MDWLGILLVVVWLLFGGINAAQKKKRAEHQPPPSPPPRPRRLRGGFEPSTPSRTETRRRGVLDTLREELERLQAEAETAQSGRGPLGRRTTIQLPGEEEVEELESLEVEPDVGTLEMPEPVRTRVLVDQDDEAEVVVRRRIEAAQSRDHALSVADHKVFDRTIRGSAPAQPSVAIVGRRPASIRDAMVWREILGPPKGLQ